MRTSKQIRQEFLDFFKEQGHTIVPSSSLVPHNDPTLIFTNAGMNQFKDVFLGTGTRPYVRAADSQKVIRVSGKHNDLEEVGRDTYHHTFFEMLGNWSFGDYYKKEAILWAWQLLTERWGLPKEKLYATVYKTDDEAERLWKEVTDIQPDHVLRFGEKDNFWEMGDTGPCGPCTEIHIDLGPERCDKSHVPGHVCGVNAGCARFIELWNLVFIQYNRKADGSLEELPAKHVDTGMGFERIVAVLQNKTSNYDTDLFTPLIAAVEEISGKKYAGENQVAMRVIADHLRSLSFAIADGALPSNEGRGYVLRRILRRAARFGRTLGLNEPFIWKLVPRLVELMGEAYPELGERMEHIQQVLRAEEEGFGRTLDVGIELFEQAAREVQAQGGTVIPGDKVFLLYDTYGFPLDLTQLMAEEKGLSVDVAGFNERMASQRERARASGKFTMEEDDRVWTTVAEQPHSEFKGYETLQCDSSLCLVGEDKDFYHLVFKETPFYAESGGQVGDTGVIKTSAGEFSVVDTVRQNDRIIHLVRKTGDFPKNSAKVTLAVDEKRRRMTAANHTATHIMQAVLREVLGDHVHQSGSLVTPERLRFDFTHFERLTPEQLAEVERRVNAVIGAGYDVCAQIKSYDEAVAEGAMALFSEKYGDQVRMVRVGDFSKELCGGTHVTNTAQIRYFRIVSEGSVATGVRRIEAVTGEKALELVEEERHLVREVAERLKTTPDQLVRRVDELLQENDRLSKELEQSKKSQAGAAVQEILAKAIAVGDARVAVARLDGYSMDLLREAADRIKDGLRSGVLLLGSVFEGKVNLVAGVTADLTGKIKAGELVKQVAPLVEGGGGGRPDMAQAGGKNPAKLDEALDAGRAWIQSKLA
ncbi:MAG TPA: alanine--tRNA ligase [Firmicutes bacterium]|jgi:alanyl-tRNA synthetase|nr:alanine--tRNA ligase [Bacillota bacterium]HOQ23315.1 alanine--tRNA ligase [Bacillota bacterium]HPT66736.1 alanine--tRNA ligase [Bacillota bacterium]